MQIESNIFIRDESVGGARWVPSFQYPAVRCTRAPREVQANVVQEHDGTVLSDHWIQFNVSDRSVVQAELYGTDTLYVPASWLKMADENETALQLEKDEEVDEDHAHCSDCENEEHHFDDG